MQFKHETDSILFWYCPAMQSEQLWLDREGWCLPEGQVLQVTALESCWYLPMEQLVHWSALYVAENLP
jgi:hypothetical protein